MPKDSFGSGPLGKQRAFSLPCGVFGFSQRRAKPVDVSSRASTCAAARRNPWPALRREAVQLPSRLEFLRVTLQARNFALQLLNGLTIGTFLS